MNREVYLILFGALVTLSVLSATDKTEETRASDKNLGKSREKLKKAKRNKSAKKKKDKSKRKNNNAFKKNKLKKKIKKVS